MGDESLEVKVARIETKMEDLTKTVEKLVTLLENSQYEKRISQLEFQMSILKWIGGTAFSVVLLVLGVLLKKVM